MDGLDGWVVGWFVWLIGRTTARLEEGFLCLRDDPLAHLALALSRRPLGYMWDLIHPFCDFAAGMLPGMFLVYLDTHNSMRLPGVLLRC